MVLRALEFELEFATHDIHTTAFGPENVSTAHGVHISAPLTSLYVPDGHLEHSSAEVMLPADISPKLHTPDPSMNNPA